MKIIVFNVNEHKYGVPLEQVKYIDKLKPITKLPQTPDYFRGMAELREKIIPIVDVGIKFNSGKVETTRIVNNKVESTDAMIVVVSVLDTDIGLLVSSAKDLIEFDEKELQENTFITDLDKNLIHGFVKAKDDLLVVLNLENILTTEEINNVTELV